MEPGANVVLGVVSGVITALVLFLGSRIWNSTVLPLLKQWKYSGVEIEGTWKSNATGTSEEAGDWSTEMSLTLNQSTLDVTGLLLVRYRSQTNCYDLSFSARGWIWEGYVTVSFTPVSKSVTSVATGLLKIAGGGTALEGRLAFRNINTDKVDVLDMILHRGELFTQRANTTSSAATAVPPIQAVPTQLPHEIPAAAGANN